MTDNSGFAAFAMYNALKLHFSSNSYDYLKYNGKTNVSQQTFMKRKDKYSFYRLSRKYSLDELKNFYISNLLHKDFHWVGEIAGPEGEETYKKWQKTNQSLTYMFEKDIIYLLNRYRPVDLIKVSDGYPNLLTELMQENITLETVCILNDVLGFLPMWERKINDDIIFPNWKLKIEKYTPFISYDKKRYKKILNGIIQDNENH